MIDSGKKAAVTGANGFIGARLCSYLLQQGYWVRALAHSDPKDSSSRLDGLVADNGAAPEVNVADICDADSLSSVFDGVDTVFHVAGVAHVGNIEETELEEEYGRYVYQLELRDDKGVQWDVELDAKTGEVLKDHQDD